METENHLKRRVAETDSCCVFVLAEFKDGSVSRYFYKTKSFLL